MGTLVLVLAGLSGLVHWWPPPAKSDDPRLFRDRPATQIEMRHIQPTNQSRDVTPAPPAPLPPVVVPNDVLITEEVDIGEAELQIETDGDDRLLQDGTNEATASRRPDTEARLLRNVQPEYPQTARREGIRARVEVEVQITKTGQVLAASVRQRWILSSEGSSRPVDRLNYGLEEAALRAARRSLFQPARQNGQAVETRKVITFTFGTN